MPAMRGERSGVTERSRRKGRPVHERGDICILMAD